MAVNRTVLWVGVFYVELLASNVLWAQGTSGGFHFDGAADAAPPAVNVEKPKDIGKSPPTRPNNPVRTVDAATMKGAIDGPIALPSMATPAAKEGPSGIRLSHRD